MWKIKLGFQLLSILFRFMRATSFVTTLAWNKGYFLFSYSDYCSSVYQFLHDTDTFSGRDLFGFCYVKYKKNILEQIEKVSLLMEKPHWFLVSTQVFWGDLGNLGSDCVPFYEFLSYIKVCVVKSRTFLYWTHILLPVMLCYLVSILVLLLSMQCGVSYSEVLHNSKIPNWIWVHH